jgi:putative component of membrane protein insertase Oxa1/YidC/SpoIIIJ protein YidD
VLRICIWLIEFYQKYLSFDTGLLRVITPGGACKYNPTCSEYTKQAMIKYGILRGGWLGIKRIWSCR